MKFEDMPKAMRREEDGPAMVRAIEAFAKAGLDARRPARNAYQIKVNSDLSFYPNTGRIVPDGKPALAKSGLVALFDVIGLAMEEPQPVK